MILNHLMSNLITSHHTLLISSLVQMVIQIIHQIFIFLIRNQIRNIPQIVKDPYMMIISLLHNFIILDFNLFFLNYYQLQENFHWIESLLLNLIHNVIEVFISIRFISYFILFFKGIIIFFLLLVYFLNFICYYFTVDLKFKIDYLSIHFNLILMIIQSQESMVVYVFFFLF